VNDFKYATLNLKLLKKEKKMKKFMLTMMFGFMVLGGVASY
jgi:hypothetical protein